MPLTWLVRGLAIAAELQTAGSGALAPAEPAAATTTQTEEFRVARVIIVGFDAAAVLAALRLRLPRLEVEHHGGPPPSALPHVYVQFSRAEGDTGHLRVITSDGRAYDRSFVIEVGGEVRVAASTAVNLLFAIEQGAVAPDGENVAIPDASADPGVDPTQAEEVAPLPIRPSLTPAIESVVGPPPPPPPPRPGWELGISLQGAAILGLGPQQFGGVFGGGGGGLGLELRSPRGTALALDVRGLGWTDAALGVGRLRIGVAGGYTWRRGRFELPVLLAMAIEPWWVTQSGKTTPVYNGGTATLRHPLVGGYVRITPALRLPVMGGLLAAVRLGPRLELGGAFAIDDGAIEVGIADSMGQQHIRLGGLELSLGFEVALQFGLGRAIL